MKLHEISFPVFSLGKEEPTLEEGVWFYPRSSDEGIVLLIIDDQNIDMPTLARRRLTLKLRGERLFTLRTAVFFIADFLKISNGATWFIDSNGKVFNYKKTKRVPLVFKKITKLIPIPTGGCLVQCEGSEARYKTLHNPTQDYKWAGLLKLNRSYILYGLYPVEHKQSTRMI